MNFHIEIVGNKFDDIKTCMQLLHQSAKESDYAIDIKGHRRLSPYSPMHTEVILTGSAVKSYTKIVVDFDDLVNGSLEQAIVISPSIISADISPDSTHYWAIFGCLIKITGDISPAYVTGYLLEKNMKKELEAFTAFSNQLPFELKIAVTELITDAN